MRGITLALIGSVCLFTSIEQAALAADMPRKAPIKAPAPVVYDWTGFYVGGHLGYGWGMKDWLDFGTPLSPNELIGSYPVRGGLLGGQVGLNYQIGHVVVGVEAAASWSGLAGDLPIAIGEIGFASKSTSKVEWLSTVTGHVGATVGRWLVSGKAGVAWLRENHTYRSVFGAIVIDDSSLEETRSGPTAGLRVECALDANWSVRTEYDYMHFRSRTTPFTGVTVAPISIEQSIHAFKLGVNYRVGAGGQPAPALAAAGYDWAGPYLGVQAGYGWGWKRWDEFNTDYDVRGGFAGGQIGINTQSGILVAGVEAEIMWAHLTGDGNLLSTFFTFLVPGLVETDTLTSKINWLAMLTGRVGVALPDRWLAYVKGGVAVAHERHSWFGDTPGANLDVSVEGTRLHTGAVVGVGVDYAVGGNWSARAEYDFLYFPRQQVATFGLEITPPADTTPTHVNFQLKQAIHLVKFGLNYHFDWQPVTVKAKY